MGHTRKGQVNKNFTALSQEVFLIVVHRDGESKYKVLQKIKWRRNIQAPIQRNEKVHLLLLIQWADVPTTPGSP